MSNKYIFILYVFFGCFVQVTFGQTNNLRNKIEQDLKEFSEGNYTSILSKISQKDITNYLLEELQPKLNTAFKFKFIGNIENLDRQSLLYLVNTDTVNFFISDNSYYFTEITLIKLFASEISTRASITTFLYQQNQKARAKKWWFTNNPFIEANDSYKRISYKFYHDQYIERVRTLDRIELIRAYEKEANNGDIHAMIAVADESRDEVNYLDDSLKMDFFQEKVIKWYLEATKYNNTYAVVSLAQIYENGEYVKQDYKKALKWYEKLNQIDSTLGLLEIASFYREGLGVEVNEEKAKKYYKKAFILGLSNPILATQIGGGYELGYLGFQKNLKEALEWYIIGEHLGDPSASYSIEEIKRQLKEEN